MTQVPFPHTLDSTILSTFRSCPHKAFRQYMQHWKPGEESVHLIAGGAFAKGTEIARNLFYSGVLETPQVSYDSNGKRKVAWVVSEGVRGNREEAVMAGIAALIAAYGDYEAPASSAKSCERMVGALDYYLNVAFPLGEDGTPPLILPSGKAAIELSFAEPLPIKHPVTGDPILYTGRSDMFVQYCGGIYGLDDKTTSSLGQSWLKQWEMRSQFTGYMWAAAQNGINLDGFLVRGVSILKTKYDHLQVPTNRSKDEISRWFDQTCRDVERWIRMWQEGYYDYALDGACTEYGGCAFTTVCKSSSPESYLPVYFHKRVWDPLARKEYTVEEYEALWAPKDNIDVAYTEGS